MNRKKYQFKPYDPDFPKLFLKESKRINEASALPLYIEHVGSTAIEGLGGKGIIDVLIAARKEHLDETLQLLQSLGYEFRKDYSEEKRLFFRIDLPDEKEGKRRYHIHLTFLGSNTQSSLIDFRDRLRKSRELRLEYEQIKKQAVSKAKGEGAIYRAEKADFFELFK